MNLIIDIGNTCIKLVAMRDGVMIDEKRILHHEVEALKAFAKLYPFEKGIWSSVVNLPDDMKEALETMNVRMMQLKSGDTRVPIIIKYKSPTTLGADRLAGAVGAMTETPGRNILIIDVGTCITYDVVNADGEYLGGNISPGPKMRFRALHDYTSRLPMVDRRGECPELGGDTETAIRSGVLIGVEYEMCGYVAKMARMYDNLVVYITGGVHLPLLDNAGVEIREDRFLVPKGLNTILEYNYDNE